MKKWVAAAAALIGLVGVVACSANSEDSPVGLTGMQEYQSVDQIGADLRARDIDCTPTQDSRSTAFTTAGRCDIAETEIVFGIFTNDSQLREYKSTTNWVAETLKTPSYLVVGSNWVANCSSNRPRADQIQAALGGQLWISRS